MLYEAALRRLVARGTGPGATRNAPSGAGLDRARRLLRAVAVGSAPPPATAVSIVHVVGTNGKGSVAWKVAVDAHRAGFRVGLYTSPHLCSLRERVRVDLRPISPERLASLADLVLAADADASYFECMTCLALRYFAEERCDVVVLEAGMGGAGDATNAVESCDVAVLTSVGLDHVKVLGSTPEAICREKLGVIKPGCSLVVGTGVAPDLNDVIFDMAAKFGAQSVTRLIRAARKDSAGGDGEDEDMDAENERTARACMRELLAARCVPAVTTSTVQQEQLPRRPPCRFQVVDDATRPNKRVILDVGHNPPALERVMKDLGNRTKEFAPKRGALVFGMAADKDVRECLRIVLERYSWVRVEFASPQAVARSTVPLPELVRIGSEYAHERTRLSTPNSGLVAHAVSACLDDPSVDFVLVCGSHGLMREAMLALSLAEGAVSPDPFDTNERGAGQSVTV